MCVPFDNRVFAGIAKSLTRTPIFQIRLGGYIYFNWPSYGSRQSFCNRTFCYFRFAIFEKFVSKESFVTHCRQFRWAIFPLSEHIRFPPVNNVIFVRRNILICVLIIQTQGIAHRQERNVNWMKRFNRLLLLYLQQNTQRSVRFYLICDMLSDFM